jgi:hypothetical protein
MRASSDVLAPSFYFKLLVAHDYYPFANAVSKRTLQGRDNPKVRSQWSSADCQGSNPVSLHDSGSIVLQVLHRILFGSILQRQDPESGGTLLTR